MSKNRKEHRPHNNSDTFVPLPENALSIDQLNSQQIVQNLHVLGDWAATTQNLRALQETKHLLHLVKLLESKNSAILLSLIETLAKITARQEGGGSGFFLVPSLFCIVL
jgi:hypothetical protein